MTVHRRPSPSRVLALVAGLCLAAVVAATALAAPPAAAQASRPIAPGSLLVHVDTRTLELGLEPAPGTVPLELSAEVLNALDTSGEGLKPVTKGNVTRIDLQGRYRGVWFAVTDADGKTKPFCLTALPPKVAAAARALRQKEGVQK